LDQNCWPMCGLGWWLKCQTWESSRERKKITGIESITKKERCNEGLTPPALTQVGWKKMNRA